MTDTTEIQRIKRDYYGKLHANNMDNLEAMDKFLIYLISQDELGRNRTYEQMNYQ